MVLSGFGYVHQQTTPYAAPHYPQPPPYQKPQPMEVRLVHRRDPNKIAMPAVDFILARQGIMTAPERFLEVPQTPPMDREPPIARELPPVRPGGLLEASRSVCRRDRGICEPPVDYNLHGLNLDWSKCRGVEDVGGVCDDLLDAVRSGSGRCAHRFAGIEDAREIWWEYLEAYEVVVAYYGVLGHGR